MNEDNSGTSPEMDCWFGPPGQMGEIICRIANKIIADCKGYNVTSNNTGDPYKTGGDGPIPPGLYYPGGPWTMHKDGRPAIHCNIPNRPGICIHTTAPGVPFGWYKTDGCIRVTPSCLSKLMQLMKEHPTHLIVISGPVWGTD